MAPRYLLDTDVLIWHLRGHRPTEALLQSIEDEQPLACSTLSVFEVWAGVRPPEEEPTRRFLGALQQIPPSGDIALRAADDWRELRQQGLTVGRADALIGATARHLELVLVTYNQSHYPMPDVQLYDPMPPV